MSLQIPERVASRAARFAVRAGDCDVSTYSAGNHGYAQIGWKGEDGKMHGTTAHRAAYVFCSGEQIPEGMTVDHTCRNRACVRYEHLRLLSNSSNGRMNAAAGHYDPNWSCPRNHPAESRFKRADGSTNCRACTDLSKQKWQAENRENYLNSQRRYNAKRKAQ